MKALILLPAAVALGGCALFAHEPRDAVVYETGLPDMATVSTNGDTMILGGATRFGGNDYETYTEHAVDTTTGTVTGMRQYVMVEGEALTCHTDCASTVARYYGVTSDSIYAVQ